jgi:manganese/zinc/iron transport system permease protein
MSWLAMPNMHALLVATAAALAMGIVSGVVGLLLMLKKQSILGVSVSYASLPGLMIAFLLVGTRIQGALLAGAALTASLMAIYVIFLVKNKSLQRSSSVNLLLTASLGLGLVFLTISNHNPTLVPQDISNFLFGEVATIQLLDAQITVSVALAVLFALFLFWKELIIVACDPSYAVSAGYAVFRLDLLLAFLVVSAVLSGIQTVGVILMGAMLVAPAVAARSWTNSRRIMLLLSMLIGGFAGVIGTILANMTPKLPIGPTIVLLASGFACLSFFFAPRRGILWVHLRQRKLQNSTDPYAVLNMLYLLSKQHKDVNHGHSEATISAFYPLKKNLGDMLAHLSTLDMVIQTKPQYWAITGAGVQEMEAKQERTNAMQSIDNAEKVQL